MSGGVVLFTCTDNSHDTELISIAKLKFHLIVSTDIVAITAKRQIITD